MDNYNDKPMSFGDWMKTILLLMIPVVNFVLMIYWAFGSEVNTSKKNYFRAQLVLSLIIFGITVIAGILSVLLGLSFITDFAENANQFQ
jgi:hypothetical protein